MSINYIKCTKCERGYHKPGFKYCFNCHKQMNQLATVVYDLGGGIEAQKEYFLNHPGHIPVGLLPDGVIPSEDFHEVYASQLENCLQRDINNT